MSDDEKGKKAGGISKFKQQYGQIGSNKRLDSQESKSQDSQPSSLSAIQPSEHQDVQLSEHLTIQDASSPTIQTSKSPDKGESSMLNSTTAERLSVQKSKQQRDKLTVYLEPDLNDWIRQQVIIEKRRRGHHVEISDIINEALQKMRDNQ